MRVIIILLVFVISNYTYGQLPLFQYNPPGSVNSDILNDITSRLGEQEKQLGYDSDPETRTHEYQHQLNSILRRVNSNLGEVNGVYLGKGYCWIMREPNCKLSDIAKNVPPEYRVGIYNTYLIDQQQWWNDRPLYITDELSAYYAGALYARQAGIQDHGSFQHAVLFIHYTEALINTIKQQDPNYPDLQALINLKEFYQERLQELQNGRQNMPQRYNSLFMSRISNFARKINKRSN